MRKPSQKRINETARFLSFFTQERIEQEHKLALADVARFNAIRKERPLTRDEMELRDFARAVLWVIEKE